MSTSSLYQIGEVKVGDIFRQNTLPGPNIFSRSWHFLSVEQSNPEKSGHKVILRHCFSSGKWCLIVDGLPHMRGFEPIVNRKFEIRFSVNSIENAIITSNRKSGMSVGFSHSLTVGDLEFQELKRTTECLNVGDKPPEHVSIPDTRLFNDGVKDVTLFQIFIKPFQGGQIIAERRFSEFIQLNKLIIGLKDRHAGTLPLLPRRVFTPWTDQQSKGFIDERRLALQSYLQSLLSNTRVCTYSEFLCFIGLDPISGNALQEPLSCSLRMSDDDDEEGFPV
jgi:PX domain